MKRLIIKTTTGDVYPAEIFRDLLDKNCKGSYTNLYNRFMKRLKVILTKQPDIIFTRHMLKKALYDDNFNVKKACFLTATVLIIDGVQTRLRDWYAEYGDIERHDCQSQAYIRFLNRVTTLINKNSSTAVSHEMLLDKLTARLDPVVYTERPGIIDEVLQVDAEHDSDKPSFLRPIIPLWKPTQVNF